MKMLQNVTIRKRLYFAFGFLITGFILMNIMVFVVIANQRDKYEKYMQLSDDTRQIQVDFKIQVQEWKNTLLRGYEKENYEKYSSSFFEKSSAIQSNLKKLDEELADHSEVSTMIKTLLVVHKSLENQYSNALQFYDVGGDLYSSKVVDKNVKGIDREPTKAFDEIVAKVNAIAIEETSKLQKNISILLLSSGTFFIFIALVLVTLIIKSINNSINTISKSFEKIADGNLTTRINLQSTDEIGNLSKLFDIFLTDIHSIIARLVEIIHTLASSSNELSSSSSTLSNTAQEQAASAEEMSATMEELVSSLEQSTENIKQQYVKLTDIRNNIGLFAQSIHDTETKINTALSFSQSISENAKSGDSSMNEMNNTMKMITTSSDKIVGIISVINDISEQINLLSLNASIEAARAGNTGRGFAVVAEQVSELAEQTSSSINEINTLVLQNHSQIQSGTATVQNTINIFNEILNGIEKINLMMEDINSFAINQSEMSNAILQEVERFMELSESNTNAANDQKNGFNEFALILTSINDYSQLNASSAEELSGNSEQISEIAEDLKSKILHFTIEE